MLENINNIFEFFMVVFMFGSCEIFSTYYPLLAIFHVIVRRMLFPELFILQS